MPSISGDLHYRRAGSLGGGASGAVVDIDSISVREALQFAAMVAAEARKGRFTLLTDDIYLDLGNAKSGVRSVDFGSAGSTQVSAGANAGTESTVRGSLWMLGGGYTLADGTWGHLDAMAGFRLLAITARTNMSLEVGIAAPGGAASIARTGRLGQNADLFDGIVGLRGRFVLGSGFHLPYAADIGTGSSRLTWQASAGVGYQTGWAGATLGYRYLYYDQRGDGLVENFSFSGPFAAVNFTF